jgi:hypothetical protein
MLYQVSMQASTLMFEIEILINEVWKLKSSKEFTLSFIKVISFNKELIIFLMRL